jgi:hypothetical protein
LRSFHGDNVGIPVEGYRNRGWMDGWMQYTVSIHKRGGNVASFGRDP